MASIHHSYFSQIWITSELGASHEAGTLAYGGFDCAVGANQFRIISVYSNYKNR